MSRAVQGRLPNPLQRQNAARRAGLDWAGRLAPLLLALVGAALAVYYSLTVPIFEAPDELWHYLVVESLAHRHFADPNSPARQEATQPPLYYALGAAAWRLAPAPPTDSALALNPYFNPDPNGTTNKNLVYHGDPDEGFPFAGLPLTVHLIRLVSVGFGVLTVVGVHRLGRLVAPNQPLIAILASAFCALNPELAFTDGVISNDAAIVATSTWTLVFLAEWVLGVGCWVLGRGREPGPNTQHPTPNTRARPRTELLLSLSLGLALLSKATAFGLAAVVGLALLWCAPAAEGRWQRLRRAVLVEAGALLLGGWWYVRLWLLYHDPLGTAVRDVALGRHTPFTLSEGVDDLGQLAITFFARFGWTNLAPPVGIPIALVVVTAVGLVAGILVVGKASGRRRSVYAVLLGWLFLNLLLFYVWQLEIPGPQGRLIFPAVGALAILWATGLTAALGRLNQLTRVAALGLLGGGALAVVIGLPLFVIVPTYAAQPVRLLSSLPAYARPLSAAFDDEVDLVGFAPPPGGASGGTTSLRLYWRRGPNAAHLLSFNVRVRQANGQVVAGKDDSIAPGFPIGHWPKDRVVEIAVPIEIPANVARPQVLSAEVGVYTQDSGTLQHLHVVADGSESVELGAVPIR
jgi:hypothetical protein